VSDAPLELRESQVETPVQEAEYLRLLGFPRGYEPTDRARELAEWARAWYAEHGSPWYYARRIGDVALDGPALHLDRAVFAAGPWLDRWRDAQADSAFVVAVSAGPQCEARASELWHEGRPDEYLFLEVYASAVVEYLVAAVSYRLCEWADAHGVAILPHCSPGYPEWSMEEQPRLFDLVAGGGNGMLPGPLSVLASGMLRPKKSLLAVFGVTPRVEQTPRLTALVPCATCSLPRCGYRRVPYQRPLPRIERVREPDRGSGDDAPPGAVYSVSLRALDKWSRERLRLETLPDRSVRARFRYDGTTCSNLGQPLAFDYDVRLVRGDQGYVVVDARCEPAPGDRGYTYMCEYLADPETLMQRITVERPLLGRPLAEVFSWRRGDSPAGCYCETDSRDHKWGVVLEVLHYALARRGPDGHHPS
jgi:hypothetical protein